MKSARHILAENLSRLMAASDNLRSQNQLAKKSRVGQTTIGNWLRLEADVSPRLDALEAVADAFGITVADLLTDATIQKAAPVGTKGDLVAKLDESRTKQLRAARLLDEVAAMLRAEEMPPDLAATPLSDPSSTPDSDYLLSGSVPAPHRKRRKASA
ncbi:hypothetical protein LMG8323_03664 [Ralstonia mannitolilytica]|nr:hypothetical protein LMG8323_03664 [Ralstonia mannitolilytica]